MRGRGLHSNALATVILTPSEINCGRRFIVKKTVIPALFTHVKKTSYCTTLGRNGIALQTVEHLLAALHGLQIDNVDIYVNGPEIPILDGSAQSWVAALNTAEPIVQNAQKKIFRPTSKLSYAQADRTLCVLPANETTVTIEIDFPHPTIGKQKSTFAHIPEIFSEKIAPARTFGFLRDLQTLQNNGLAQGASLQNTLAFDDDQLHPEQQLRFHNEPLVHKLLDLLGDLALFPQTIHGHIHCHKPGHGVTIAALNHWFSDLTGRI